MKTLTLRLRYAGSGLRVKRIWNGRWLIIPFLLLAMLTGYYIYEQNQSEGRVLISGNSQASNMETIGTEKQYPEEYVSGQVKMRRNFFNEIIIEGSLRNIARYTNYKDPVLQVDFISKTGAVLFTKDYPVQGLLQPNGAIDYKFKNPALNDVEKITGRILKAEVCE